MFSYLYGAGDIGQLARDALLLIMTVSRDNDAIGQFIADLCNFCPVLATGLSGCFSQLPRHIASTLNVADDWHGVTSFDIENDQSLMDFYSSLIFCNSIVRVVIYITFPKIIVAGLSSIYTRENR